MYANNTKTNLLARGSLLQYQANSANRGGGVCFAEYSKLYIVKPQAEYLQEGMPEGGPRVMFTGNSADNGGAMYISDDTNTDTCSSKSFVASSTTNECFLQTLAKYSTISPNLNTVNIQFFNNSARISGSDLYGGLLDRCTVNPLAEVFLKAPNVVFMDGVSYIQYITNISLNSITSDPVRLCFCRDGQPDCSYQPGIMYITSDSVDQLSAVAVDQMNRTIPSIVHSSLTPQTPYEGFPQNVSESCTDLGLSTLQCSTRILLYPDGPCNQAGISQRFIDVVSLFCSCPIGFQPSTSETGCVCICDSDLHPYITRCSFELASVLREGNFWVAFTNSTSPVGFQVHPYCPYDYCLPHSTPVYINFNIPKGADVQCAHNRSGTMCGTCASGLSVTFGSSHCKSCSNQWLALLLLFALCGIPLVAFLLICNMTIAVGTINGLALYADIVNAYSTIFYPSEKPAILSTFIAWLSLDFGIETCFYNGMDAYAKAWLQFVFPIYITALAAVLSVVSHQSKTLTKLLSNRLVPLMATVVFLSWSKLFRIILTALSFTRLDYPDGSQQIVWLVDPSIVYLEGKHIPLFVAGVVIGVVGAMYALLLFFGQWILRCPQWKLLKFVQHCKVKEFLNAHYAPFNQKHSFFFGLLVMVRLVLYLVSALNAHGDPNVNLVSIMTVLVFLLSLKLVMTGKIYTKWLVGTIETSFICNIVVFTSITFYVRETNGNQSVVSYISTGVAVTTFIGIIVYHIYTFICKTLAKRFQGMKYLDSTKQHSGNDTDQHNIELQEPTEVDSL